MTDELSTIRDILKNSRDQLLTRKNVVATGIGYKVTDGTRSTTLSIVCSVTEKVKISQLSSQDRVPVTLAGIPTDIVQTGPIRALQSPTERYRPAPGSACPS